MRSLVSFFLDIKFIQEIVVNIAVRFNGTLDTGSRFNCPVIITLKSSCSLSCFSFEEAANVWGFRQMIK